MLTYTKPKAVLFDWDNTLADTWPIIHEALHATFTAMGHQPWTIEQTKQNTHFSLRDAFPEMFGERWQEAREIYYDTFLKVHLEKLAILPQAVEVLEFLRSTGVFMGVVSNKTGKYLREEVEYLGWQKYFDVVIGATDAPTDKPTAAPLLLALKNSGISPASDVWLVGDAITDVECAFNAGCTPVFYGPYSLPLGYTDSHPHRAEDIKHMRHVKDHAALLQLFKEVGLCSK
jgi:phosphoglycolate phosphatase